MAALDIKKADGGVANDWPTLKRFKTVDCGVVVNAALLTRLPLDLPDTAANPLERKTRKPLTRMKQVSLYEVIKGTKTPPIPDCMLLTLFRYLTTSTRGTRLHSLTLADLHRWLVVDGRSSHSLLDLSGHCQESLFDIRSILRRGFEKRNADTVGELLQGKLRFSIAPSAKDVCPRNIDHILLRQCILRLSCRTYRFCCPQATC